MYSQNDSLPLPDENIREEAEIMETYLENLHRVNFEIPQNPELKRVIATKDNRPLVIYSVGSNTFLLKFKMKLSKWQLHSRLVEKYGYRETSIFCWHFRNIQLGKCFFPSLKHAPDFSWIMIPNFPLSSIWNKRSTPLLIIQPGLNGDIFNCCPDNFFCDKGLRYANGDCDSHILESSCWNNYAEKNWARISWHINHWKPSRDVISGHNLLSILEGLNSFFRKRNSKNCKLI